MKLKNNLVLFFILIFGFLIRLIGLNWDQGQHLHPDERFLTMVLTDISLPASFSDYINPQISPLNPYNHNFDFFVYGSFPLNFIKVMGQILNQTSYHQIYLVGRIITVCLDTSVIFLVFLIAQKIFNPKSGLIAAFLYSICVLPIQLSHFFTVDPFLNFFLTLTFYLLLTLKPSRPQFFHFILLSLSYSLAITSKISAIYFAPVILLFFIFHFKNPKRLFVYGLSFSFLTLFFVRLNQPQLFTSGSFLNWNPNPQFLSNLKDLKSYDRNPIYPPSIQWLKVSPLIFPLQNIIFWGLGLPFGSIFILSLVHHFFNLVKNPLKSNFYLFIVIFWILFLFIVQGIQPVTTMRYFLPIYPFISIITATLIYNLFSRKSKLFNHPVARFFLIFSLLFYPFLFMSIYFKDHPRVAASKWIYQHLPPSSTIAVEYWDDALPLSIGASLSSDYQYQILHVADYPDTDTKINHLLQQLSVSDYLILSSNRFYQPIPANSDIFPRTSTYYHSLFSGDLGFSPIAQFTSYPCFFSFCLNDDFAEEAFTVYDHPKVIIFQKNRL